MSAPISAYRDGKLNMGQPSDPKSHLIAILQTSKAVMLSRFYLDELLPVKLPDGTDGVVGAVIIGGANEEMHNITTRGGGGRIMVAGQPARLLNDAGLNTSGIINDLGSILEENNVENFIIPTITSKSAYWVDGTFGVEYSINGGAWTKIPISYQTANNEVTVTDFNIAEYFEYNQEVSIRLYHENAEKTYRSNTLTTTVWAAPIIMKFDDTFASVAASSPTSQTYYYTVRGLLMSTLFLDALGSTEAPEGYYVSDGWWYKHEYSPVEGKRIVTDFGRAEPGQYPDGDPANPTTGYTEFNWYAYHATSQSGACSLAFNPVTTYRRNSDGKHFMNNTLTTPAPDGYYIEEALSKGWFQMVGQLLVNSGSC